MKIEIPEGDFAGFIFDCDGTLADTMPLHFRAWERAFERHGFRFEQGLYYRLGGVPARELIALLNTRYGLSLPVEEIVRTKEAAYLELAAGAERIQAVTNIVEEFHGRIPMAVASGGGHRSVMTTLAAIGLLDRFQVVVTNEDVTHGKPHPETFLTAAARLDVSPKRCLVFEDAPPGIEAAEAAGMRWVHVPSGTA